MGNVTRPCNYGMSLYLQTVKNQTIRLDAPTQRDSDQWDNNEKNLLIRSCLDGDYVPDMMFAEDSNGQLWLIDGLQRTSILMSFRYCNYKITTSVEQPIITYKVKKLDENGVAVRDENDDFVYDYVDYDIRNKTYNDLPFELKHAFDSHDANMVIFENCDKTEIPTLIRRYNNHHAMNPSQKAYTFCDRFSVVINKIKEGNFFNKSWFYTSAEKKNGACERVIMETIMLTYFRDNWKVSPRDIAKYLNDNAIADMFETLYKETEYLYTLTSKDEHPEFKSILVSKNMASILAAFHEYCTRGLDYEDFGKFLEWFVNNEDCICSNELSWEIMNSKRNTKDKKTVTSKLNIVLEMMNKFFQSDENSDEETFSENSANNTVSTTLEFIRSNVSNDINSEDLELYSDVLDDVSLNVDNNTPLLDKENRPSLLALIGYAFNHDIEIDDWLPNYFGRTSHYYHDQFTNYNVMVNDLNKYISVEN